MESAIEAHNLSTLLIPAFLQANTPLRFAMAKSWARQTFSSVQCVTSSCCFLDKDSLSRSSAESSPVVARRGLLMGYATLVLFSISSFSAASVTIDYVYDDLNRLTGAARNEGTPMVLYHYDEVSNIKWISTQSSPDTDGDDVPNFVDPDDDNDGIPDITEIDTGLNPLLTTDATGDRDGDGISNIDEYVLGSDINHFHGDVDSDGDLDLGDIVIFKRIVFEQVAATQEQGESGHGDVNIDGNLDVGDLVILQRLYFGN